MKFKNPTKRGRWGGKVARVARPHHQCYFGRTTSATFGRTTSATFGRTTSATFGRTTSATLAASEGDTKVAWWKG